MRSSRWRFSLLHSWRNCPNKATASCEGRRGYLGCSSHTKTAAIMLPYFPVFIGFYTDLLALRPTPLLPLCRSCSARFVRSVFGGAIEPRTTMRLGQINAAEQQRQFLA